MSDEPISSNLAIPVIDLSGHQCFPGSGRSLKLRKYTFIYGPNGTGKSTLLREIRAFAKSQNDSFTVKSFDQGFVRNLLNPDFAFEGVLRVVDAPPEIAQRIEALTAADDAVIV